MRAKTKFNKFYRKCPIKGRSELCYIHKWDLKNLYSLDVCYLEINHDTKLGKEMLEVLGFKDD